MCIGHEMKQLHGRSTDLQQLVKIFKQPIRMCKNECSEHFMHKFIPVFSYPVFYFNSSPFISFFDQHFCLRRQPNDLEIN